MNTCLSLFSALVLAGFLGTVEVEAAAIQIPFRGVVGIDKKEAELDDRITVRVRELDGFLIEQMRSKFILGENYFDSDTFRRWLVFLESRKKDKERANGQYGQWIHNWLENLNSAGDDKDLLQAYDTLRRDVWASFYLVLGNSRLKHVKAEKPYGEPRFGPDGATFRDLTFVLKKDSADAEEWDKLFHGAQHRVPVAVRVGFDLGAAQYTLDTVVPETMRSANTALPAETGAPFGREFCFVAYGVEWMALGLVFVAIVLVVFLILATTTALVRDPDLPRRTDEGKHLQFNLARCQTAFWFFLFTAAYLFLGAAKGWGESIITDQCLVLLGISTGTTLGSAFISKTARSGTPPPVPCPYQGVRRFLWELLSDDAGRITFYRFQMLVWTLVLGMVFVSHVYRFLEMPKFGVNELALMGISAGTYLGFKFPEVKGGPKEPEAKSTAP